MKYLLIDGNNLAIRAAFANSELQNQDGIPTGVHFGVFQSLITLKKRFKEYQFLMAWDGKSKRRVEESKRGVEQGIVPSGYKDNRKKGDEMPKQLLDFYSQSDFLKIGIGQLGIPQIRLPEFEADDVIASYAKILKKNNFITVVTSDKDYWQILDENVVIWDGMKHLETTKKSWENEYGISTDLVVDIGALCGDTSDNIFGVPGWGEKTAIKELKAHKSWKNILSRYHSQHDCLRNKYPDLTDEKEFNIIKEMKSDPDKPTSRLKFADIQFSMPFTGVCKAFNDGLIKIPKTELMALMFEKRIELAYSLKRMDDDIPDLPLITKGEINHKRVIEYLEYYDIYSLHDDIITFGEI